MTPAKVTAREILRWLHTYGSEVPKEIFDSAIEGLCAASVADEPAMAMCPPFRDGVIGSLQKFQVDCAAYMSRSA